jgi:hypothetical protein
MQDHVGDIAGFVASETKKRFMKFSFHISEKYVYFTLNSLQNHRIVSVR